MFLAAVTSLQGSIFYFVMYAFKLSGEAASSLTGTLTSVIGIFIINYGCLQRLDLKLGGTQAAGADQRYCGSPGKCPAAGHIWVPQLAIVYVAGTIIVLPPGYS